MYTQHDMETWNFHLKKNFKDLFPNWDFSIFQKIKIL